MARAKKETAPTPEERLQAALVPDWEWPYKLPENWCWTRITVITDILNGFAFKSQHYSSAGIRIIRITNVQDGFIQDKKPVYYPLESQKEITPFMLKDGDFLMSLTGNVGRVAIIDASFLPAALNQRVACLRIKSEDSVRKEYIFYFCLQKQFVSDCIKSAKGSAQLNMSTEWLKEYPIPLPPLAEQQRIVDRIESLFAKLDEAKEKAQAVVDSFETRKAAILHKAFTGELTAKWREEHYATDNTVLMDIKNYSSSWSAKEKDLLSREQAKSEVVVLDNGHEWIRCTIGAVGRVTNGSTPLRKEPKYWSGKIPWISSGEVRNNIIESSNECISEEGYANSSVKLLPIGTVLIAMIGEGKTRGQSAILNIEATINQNVAAIVVEHNCVLPYYIWYWLQMNYTKNREKGSGSGPQALNCQRVRELDFFVPNLKEQKEVVNILRKALAQEQQVKEAAEAVLDQIDLMKKSILARAFRGELGTNDPSEESAVKLLR